MNIFGYKIELVITKNGVNEREIIREVNRVLPKNAKGISNHILRIKTIRDHPEYWYGLEIGEQVSLSDAKSFADKHWRH